MHQELFHRPAGRYFLSHSIGLRPLAADKAVEDGFAGPWRRGDGNAWAHWLETIEKFREGLAPLIGADAGDICPQTNVSSALTKIIFSLPERARRKKIVLTEEDFPTIGFVMAQAQRAGYELVFLPGGAALADPDAWAPAFADDVQLVHITHVLSNMGVKTPVAEIVSRARARGVFTVVDAAQSSGAVPVAANDWGADFLTGTSVKYLCGGPGAAFLHTTSETAARCAPMDAGWFSHETPFEMDIHNFKFAPNALRYYGGTPSVAPFAAAAAGIETLRRIGMKKIDAHNQALISRLVSALPEQTILSHAKEGERGSSVIVKVSDPAGASKALFDAGLIHDARMGGLRFSVHLYTSEDDVDMLAEMLTGALADMD